jgi:signal transduction histidine kinase
MATELVKNNNTIVEPIVLPEPSAIAQLLRKTNWQVGKLGHINEWPEQLVTAFQLCLHSKFSMFIAWGKEHYLLYNDAALPCLGNDKHPQAFGNPAAEVWHQTWQQAIPVINQVYATRAAYKLEHSLMFINKEVCAQENYSTFSISPIFNANQQIAGLLIVAANTTEMVLAHRRIQMLNQLNASEHSTDCFKHNCSHIKAALESNLADIPCSALYVLQKESAIFKLCSLTGFTPQAALPDQFDGDAVSTLPWSFAASCQNKNHHLLELDKLPVIVPKKLGRHTPTRVLVKAIFFAQQDQPIGFIILGLSPHLVLDEDYTNYLNSICDSINRILNNILNNEIERQSLEKLARLDAAKTIFFTNVSHEFRTPLTLIHAPIEDALYALAHGNFKVLYPYLKTIQRNALRLHKLVNRLLDFARIEANRLQPELELVNLSQITTDLASVFRSIIERAGLKYEINCEPLPSSVQIDRDMWEKIVLNIISNAFKFTFQGKISVCVTAENEFAKLIITDTGIGIAPADMPKLFERFQRIEVTRARTHESSGIGLALVKELIEMLNGTIQVESSPGVGTTVTVRIPFVNQEKQISLKPTVPNTIQTTLQTEAYVEEATRWLESPTDTQALTKTIKRKKNSDTAGSRILIAEDNPDMREYLTNILAAQNWNVVQAKDGAHALQLMKQTPVDLIVSDVMMPTMNGITLLRTLRQHEKWQKTPIILLSACASEDSRLLGFDEGADDYLIKPFSAREVIARIKAHLLIAKRYQLEKENAELRAAKKQAERISRNKDLFLATLSHELRTPLTSIICWIQMVKSGKLTTDKIALGMNMIEESALAQKQLINDLLDVSSIILDKISIHLEDTNLVYLLNNTVDSLRPEAEKKAIKIITTCQVKYAPVKVDHARMRQILWNLLTNAMKFTPNEGKIYVSLDLLTQEGVVQITIKDTGIGIDAKTLPFIFDRFNQASEADSTHYRGLGLGLTIVRSLVKLQGGRISAHSEGLGKGSTFMIRLPLQAEESTPHDKEISTRN